MVKERREETLDPEDWDEMRALGHRMLDDMMTYLQEIRYQKREWLPQSNIRNIRVPLTSEGEGEEKVYEVFKKDILPYSGHSPGPRFWPWVSGTGSPYGMLAEMIRAGMNGCAEEIMIPQGHVHRQVIDWVKELLEYPEEAGGVLVSGGSEANFTALSVARNAKAEVDMKAKGMQGVPRKMTLYVSDEGHLCLERSVELIGLGNEALRWVPTDDECTIKLDALDKEIRKDRKIGNHPFCIIGNAGTVNSGAFDDLSALADLASKEKMWFHVDGAFGAWVKISETHKHLADGLERADSLAVDLHKWMDMPYGIGCTLVKDKRAHYSTFVYGHEAEYLKTAEKMRDDELSSPLALAIPLSRRFESLKAYMLLRAYGRNKYSRLVQQNIDHINYLAELVRREPRLEITAPVSSNIVCFRYKPQGYDESRTEELNKKILGKLWEDEPFIISDTSIKGRYALRACNVNHRSRREDFEYLVDKVVRIGGELEGAVC